MSRHKKDKGNNVVSLERYALPLKRREHGESEKC